MNELTIKFNRPKLALNTLTGSNQIVDNFTMWDEVSKPYPATKNVPDWFKQASQWDGRLGTVPTIKKCHLF